MARKGIEIRRLGKCNMVYCIECVYKRWEHQEVNAGLINQIARVAHEEQITVIAGEEHNEVLKTYFYMPNVTFKDFDFGILEANDRAGIVMAYEYEECLLQLFRQEKLQRGDRVFFLYINKSWLGAMEHIGLLYYDVVFWGVIHANLEKMDPQSEQFETDTECTMQTAMNSIGLLKNIHIITYSPHAKDRLKPYIDEGIWNRMYFLNHPIKTGEASPDTGDCKKDKKVRIGVFGACVNKEALRIIEQAAGCTESMDLEIIILSRHNLNDKISDRRVQVYFRRSGFRMEEIRELIRNCSWILLPYDRSKYQVCASGILVDAIRYEVPLLALDSPYTVYYHAQAPIGYVVETEEELAKKIAELADGQIDDGRERFVSNMRNLKDKMEQENHENLTKMLCGKETEYSLEELEEVLRDIRDNGNTLWNQTERDRYKETIYQHIQNERSLSRDMAILRRLLTVAHSSKTIGDYLLDKGYHSVAVYGLGYLGKYLCCELKRGPVPVLCGIDRRGQTATDMIKVVTLEEFTAEPDLIIITVLYDYVEIEKVLREHVGCKIISMEDLLSELE